MTNDLYIFLIFYPTFRNLSKPPCEYIEKERTAPMRSPLLIYLTSVHNLLTLSHPDHDKNPYIGRVP